MISKEKTVTDEIVAYSIDGTPFTKEQYIAHIEAISKSVENGARTYTSEEVREYVLNRKR